MAEASGDRSARRMPEETHPFTIPVPASPRYPFARRWRLAAVLSAALAATGGAHALGDFRPPIRLGDAGQDVESFRAGLDFFGNLTVAYEESGQIVLAVRVGDSVFSATVGPGREPSVAFHPLGVFVAYSAPVRAGDGEGRIFLASRLGAQWNGPEALSEGSGDDRLPSLALTPAHSPAAAWERRSPSGATAVWFRRAGSEPIPIGDGERPSLLFDKAGRAHVLYAAEGRILLRSEASSAQPGVFGEPRAVTPPVEGGIRFSAALSRDQSIHVAYSDGEAVFTTDNALGPFSTPIEIARGKAREPCVSISEGSAKAVAFERDGDVHVCLGTTFFLPEPTPVAASEETETSPAPIFDPLGTLAIVFRRGGEIYTTTDAGIPQAKFSAEPTSGPAPLRVSFRDESVGPVAGWRWEFGDGTVSTERHPFHVFELAGEYTVSLSVSGPGGDSPVSFRQAIRVFDPRNEVYVGRLRVFPGQRDVHVPVIASHDAPAQGFTIVATYDPRVLAVKRAAFEKTNTEALRPELFALTVSDDPADPSIVLGVLFDVEPPFDGRQLPPGRDRRVADIVVDVRPDAPAGSKTRVELKNQLGRPPLNNIITVRGRSVLPVLRPGGEIELAHLRFPPPRFFLRGDTNGDRTVNLTDAVTTLNYLFYGKEEPDCFDAADATDDGELDITDSIFTLNFLFLSGSCPQAPYPDPGLDPTDDGLPPCLLR